MSQMYFSVKQADMTIGLNDRMNRKGSIQETNKSGSSNNNQEISKACSEFESLFISYLLKEMRATVPDSGFIHGGNAEHIYQSMLDGQIGRELALKGGVGLSSILIDRLNSKASLENDGVGHGGVKKQIKS